MSTNRNLLAAIGATVLCVAGLLALDVRAAAAAENTVTAGEFVVEPPTLINLGFEWFIAGDDNRNATVDVRYRKKGSAAWKAALPLVRLQGEEIYRDTSLDVVSPNMFAGSILDLEADTEYDCAFDLSDPDGGKASKAVTVRTRREPTPFEGGRVFHVYPHGYKGTKIEPAFDKAEDFDFRLTPNSAAVDRGVAIPNVNENFTGRAPDLGALEVGHAMPHFGPRPVGFKE